jgi:hypothetical protein
MLRVYASIAVGCAAAVSIFARLVSGKRNVTLRNWRGILVLYLLGMGSIRTVEFLIALVLGN